MKLKILTKKNIKCQLNDNNKANNINDDNIQLNMNINEVNN